jgi:hypothetical protein
LLTRWLLPKRGTALDAGYGLNARFRSLFTKKCSFQCTKSELSKFIALVRILYRSIDPQFDHLQLLREREPHSSRTCRNQINVARVG